MRFSLVICLLLLGNTNSDHGEESLEKIFSAGNDLYRKGDYSSAESHYLRLLNAGVESGPLYYNLGNACFKQKKLGEAIYYWEKTRQKLPGDRDLRENLELANLLVVDRIEFPPDPFPLRVLSRAMTFLTEAQMGWLALVFFVAANGLFTIYLLTRGAARALVGSLCAALLAVHLGGALAWRVYDKNYRQEGVVVQQRVDVRSGPGSENITVFSIHEGILVRIRGKTDGWYQVSLPNGWNGWLQQDAVRIL